MLSYVKCKIGDKPPYRAVEGGYDDGPSYVARGVVQGMTIPGKVGVESKTNLRFGCAGIPYGSKEYRLDSFEVLTVDDPYLLSYVKCKTGDPLPVLAIQGGADNGGKYYHARGVYKDLTIPGKVGVNGDRLKQACIPCDMRENVMDNFEVLVEADKIVDVKFDLNKGKILTTNPKIIAVQEIFNDSSEHQSKEFSYSEAVSKTSTFTHQWGVSIAKDAKFSAELPTVVKGEITTKASASVTLTWGKSETIQKTVTGKNPVQAAPHTKIRCEVVANESKLEVPYTFYFKSGKESGGTWQGVSTWDVKTSFEEKKINP